MNLTSIDDLGMGEDAASMEAFLDNEDAAALAASLDKEREQAEAESPLDAPDMSHAFSPHLIAKLGAIGYLGFLDMLFSRFGMAPINDKDRELIEPELDALFEYAPKIKLDGPLGAAASLFGVTGLIMLGKSPALQVLIASLLTRAKIVPMAGASEAQPKPETQDSAFEPSDE